MKFKDITRLSSEEREKKIKELKVELIKSRSKASKTGNTNTREIKKTIAKIMTFNSSRGGVDKK